MDGRMKQILAILDSAEIVGSIDASAVMTGVVVEIRYEGDADDETVKYLYGSLEERRDGLDVMSPSSPLGSALLGRKPGEIVEYEAPRGHLRVEIVSISA